MTPRDRLYSQKCLIAWAEWLRAGRTFQNAALGYPTSTVEFSLMRGCAGATGPAGSRVPCYFNGDAEIERLDKRFWRYPEEIKETLLLVFYHKKQERHAATILNLTRHQIRKHLNQGYELTYQAISTGEISHY